MPAVGVLLILLQVFSQELMWHRLAIEKGEVWRFASGHFVHLGWEHLAQNVLAMATMTVLFKKILTPLKWLLLLVVLSSVVGLGQFYLVPDLQWYCGLSGVLHGVWLYASAMVIWGGSVIFGVIAICLLVLKLVVEIWGYGISLESIVPVVYEAHFLGSLFGGVVFLVSVMWHYYRSFLFTRRCLE